MFLSSNMPSLKNIDMASYNSLLAAAPDVCSHILALSLAISHTGDWLNVVPYPGLMLHVHDREFGMSGLLAWPEDDGWQVQMPNVRWRELLILSETIKWGVHRHDSL